MPKTTHSFTGTTTPDRHVTLSVTIPNTLWEKVNEYRRMNDLTMSRATSELLALGLVGHKQKKGAK